MYHDLVKDDTWPRIRVAAKWKFDEIKFEPSRDLELQKIVDPIAESASWKQPKEIAI